MLYNIAVPAGANTGQAHINLTGSLNNVWYDNLLLCIDPTIASPTKTGVVKVGNGLTVAGDGTVSTTIQALLASTAAGQGDSLIATLGPIPGEVATYQHYHNQETVSLYRFMTPAQAVAWQASPLTYDMTAIVRPAVNACVVNMCDLDIPGQCLLTAGINIDRPFLPNGSNPNWFTIKTSNGGGFYCTTAINMFGSSIAFTNAPVSHLIRFSGIKFVGGAFYNTTAAYVLNDGQLFRVNFDHCSFIAIKCLNASASYVQSISFDYCNVRGFSGPPGVFFNSQLYTYDLSVIGGLWRTHTEIIFTLEPQRGADSLGFALRGLKLTVLS